MTERLIYAFDALCGWCYGIVPAMRRVRDDHPGLAIEPVFPGLVTGQRVGPYAEMEGYIRGASARLREVTGRAPSEAFFDLIAKPGVRGDSGPPTAVFAHVKANAPDRLLEVSHAVTEAHFETGADLNDPASYGAVFDALGLDLDVPRLDEGDVIARTWAEGRSMGITSFPTLILNGETLPPIYDPEALSARVAEGLKG
jgi:putative protein-disulfide isomerase